MSLRAVNERTFETRNRNNGVVTATARLTVSEDGKTLTESIVNVDAQGQTVSTVNLVFDRVAPVP